MLQEASAEIIETVIWQQTGRQSARSRRDEARWPCPHALWPLAARVAHVLGAGGAVGCGGASAGLAWVGAWAGVGDYFDGPLVDRPFVEGVWEGGDD